MTAASPAEFFVCDACGWATADDGAMEEHLVNNHFKALDGWRCECGSVFGLEQDAEACCGDGFPGQNAEVAS